MKRLLMLGVLLLLSQPAFAQHDQLERVVRRGDRRGVILLFKTQLDQPTQPKDARAFVLVDLTAEQTIGLKDQSVTTPDRCPQPEEFESSLDRVCVELEDASPALIDTHQYALLTAPIQLKGVLVPALTVAIPPVSGAVQPIQNGTDDVEIVFSRDLSGEAVVPRITWNGVSQTVMNPPAAPGDPPQCYRRGSLSFLCTLRHRVPNGAVVSADLVTVGGQPAGFGDIAPTTAQVKAPEKKEDVQVFYLNVGLARAGEVTNGSVTFTTKRLMLRRLSRIQDPVYAALLFHSDVLITSKTNGSGRLSAGPRLELSLMEPYSLADITVTPRWETDDDFTVHNTLVDAEARLYIPGLHTGPAFKGTWQLFPRVGYEFGHTMRGGGDTLRWEDNGPSRFTYGASASLSWPANPRWFFGGGIQFTAEVDELRLQRNERSPTSAHRVHFWTLGGTVKVTPDLGFTLTRRSGRLPPLFKFQSALEIGASFMH